uniref:RMT2 domain-containing protein n=1 Tax=Mesocestoides corti TaxID=53468 RepID=A0A5K3EZA6_MESCO
MIVDVSGEADDSNNQAAESEGQSSRKRKHDDPEEKDVEMSYEPTQEDIRMILAASEGNLEEIKTLNNECLGDICFQDPKTGMSVLMAAAGSGHADVVRYLLEEGAPWNAVDRQYRCAGDYAAMNHHQAIIDIILNHAVISELLLSIATPADEVAPTNLPSAEEGAAIRAGFAETGNDGSALAETKLNAAYLASRLEYTPRGDRLVDTSTQLAVMMDWEKPLMAHHAAWICFATPSDDTTRPEQLRTLNVGFGMGIVDAEIMKHKPAHHTIIEAHPQVLEKMAADGWMDRADVEVCRGRWQDVLPQLAAEIESGQRPAFDGVFFDTYAEDDRDLNNFHRFLPRIMSQHPRARYSYYNGMCPDNVFFHGVACETTRLRLERLGFACNFVPMPVKEVADPALWENLSRRYWHFDTYFLPQCTRRPASPKPDDNPSPAQE